MLFLFVIMAYCCIMTLIVSEVRFLEQKGGYYVEVVFFSHGCHFADVWACLDGIDSCLAG